MSQQIATTPQGALLDEPIRKGPPAYDRATDDLIVSLQSGAEQGPCGKLVLHTWPTPAQRETLDRRRRDIRDALLLKDNRDVGMHVATMLACFASLRAEDAKSLVTKYVAELQGLPPWAVARGCYQIRNGQAPGISHVHPPSTIQVRVLVSSIVEPCRIEHATLTRLLEGEKYRPPTTPEQRQQIKVGMDKLIEQLKQSVSMAEAGAVQQARERYARRMTGTNDRTIALAHADAGTDPEGASPFLAKALDGTLKSKGTPKRDASIAS